MTVTRFVKLPIHHPSMTREKVGDVDHFVFSYRERATTAQRPTLAGQSPTMNFTYTKLIADGMADQPGIPARLQFEAERHAEKITAILRLFTPVMRRHRPFGALDSSKLARLARPGLSEREFEFEAGRAYKRREAETRVKQIKVAVVGDFNYKARSRDAQYAPTMSALIHTLSQACVIAGVPCAAYGTRGHLGLDWADVRDHGTSAQTVIATGTRASAGHSATAVLKAYDDEMNGPTFALLSDENLFSLAYCSNDFGKGSESGNGGIEYARAKGADFVVAFGNFPRQEERALADVLLPAGTKIDAAVGAVVDALQRRLDDAA